MSKEEVIILEGKVLEILKGGHFVVEVDLSEKKHKLETCVSGKMRINMIRILPGDTVVMEISPYDLTRGRIVYRK